MKKLIIMAALLPLAALARMPTTTPDPEGVAVTSLNTPIALSRSGSRSSSRSAAVSGSRSAATGGRSSSVAGGGEASNALDLQDNDSLESNDVLESDIDLDASSDDDTLILGQQVPAVFLPMILESGCRTGINAGGSDNSGAGAAGFSWTTGRCYAIMVAVNFFAIGEYESGCDLLVDATRRSWKRIGKKPDCVVIARRLLLADALKAKAAEIVVHDHGSQKCLTASDLVERDRRIIDKCVGK